MFRSLLAALALALPTTSVLAQTGPVRISQIFPNGGTSAGLPNADFVELFNASDQTVSLAGWSVQTAAATGTAWNVVPLAGSIAPRRYYLVRLETPSLIGSTYLPNVFSTSASIGVAGGKVALVNTATPLTGSPSCWLPAQVVDFVGYGTADVRQPCSGTSAQNAPAPSTLQALFRRCNGLADGLANSQNFTVGTPNPRNNISPANTDQAVAATIPASVSYASGAPGTLDITGVTSCDGTPVVSADLSALGGSASATGSLVVAGTYRVSLPASAPAGQFVVPVTVRGVNHAATLSGQTLVTAALANDECSGAIDVSGTLPRRIIQDLSGATNGTDTTVTCGSPLSTSVNRRATWFRFTAPANGRFVVQIDGWGLVSARWNVHFYTGACSALTPVCPALSGIGYYSRTIDVTAGTTYRLQVVNARPDLPVVPLDTAFEFQPATTPANETPCTAATLALNVAQTANFMYAAPDDPADAPTLGDCAGNFEWALWYRFTPSATGVYGLDALGGINPGDWDWFTLAGCPAAPTLTPVSVWASSPWGTVDDPLPGGGTAFGYGRDVQLTGGVTYLLRVSDDCGLSAPARTAARVRITPSGACCSPAGGCSVSTGSRCEATGGSFLGAGSACAPFPCPAPPNDSCAQAAEIEIGQFITSSLRNSTGTSTEGPTPPCIDSPTTRTFSRSLWYRFVPPASTFYEITLCNSPADTIVDVLTGPCVAPTIVAGGCNDNAFCNPSITSPGPGPSSPNASRIPFVFMAAGQPYLVRVSASTFISSGSPNAGVDFGLTIRGTGVCCRGTTCSGLPLAECTPPATGIGATFRADAGACNASGVSTSPCCHADFDKLGGVTVDDIFIYLNAWFAASPFARINGTGLEPTVDDIFVFLNAWFAGC
jgi:hypothetical protein